MGRKRGEAVMAMEVSILIFLIALAILGYIILLPAEDRDALLGTDTDTSTSSDGTSGSVVLLSEAPGELSSSKSSSQTRSLEPMRLYSTSESATEDLATSLTVSRNILQDNHKTISFDMDNLDDLESLGLLFLISESKGDLIVELNDNVVYEGEVSTSDLPLTLPTNSLEEEDNVLKLSTSLNYNPFSADYYLLQDVQLVEDYTVSSTSSSRTFSVDDPGSVTKAELTYYITCNSDEDGILTISLNSREVFSDQIFCEYLNERELSLTTSYIGSSNTLTFDITEGDYNIEEASVEISFADTTSDKEATVTVQEFSFNFDTESGSYEKDITAYVDNGANSLTVEPSTSFEVDNIKVYVADA